MIFERYRSGTSAGVAETSKDAIYERILRAVLEHRLPPGTRLVEDKLAEHFETNRSQVREVLTRLAHEGIATAVLHRGAFVASPTPSETKDIFEARRLIEPGIVQRLANNRTDEAMCALRAIVADEHMARANGDRPLMIRLACEFHILLAECAGNVKLVGPMRALCTLTCLSHFLYDVPHARACREDEHQLIVETIAQARPRQAADLLLMHLSHAEHSLDFTPRAGVVDIAVALESVTR